MEYFANRLVAEKANKNVNLSPYNKLIGAWNFEMKCFDENGNIEDESNGEWIFSYILDGTGIQDIFIWPRRNGSMDYYEQGECGTTIRMPRYDKSGKWDIVYASKWAVDHLIGEEINGQIIQTGINRDKTDTTIWQWNFIDIQQNSFVWESIWSKDNGVNWHIATRVQASRKK